MKLLTMPVDGTQNLLIFGMCILIMIISIITVIGLINVFRYFLSIYKESTLDAKRHKDFLKYWKEHFPENYTNSF